MKVEDLKLESTLICTDRLNIIKVWKILCDSINDLRAYDKEGYVFIRDEKYLTPGELKRDKESLNKVLQLITDREIQLQEDTKKVKALSEKVRNARMKISNIMNGSDIDEIDNDEVKDIFWGIKNSSVIIL